MTDAVEKRFSRRELATLIQDRSPARNIDSKNAAPGFVCCQRAAVSEFFDSIDPLRISRTMNEFHNNEYSDGHALQHGQRRKR
jgi:hypothetical protein